MNALKILKDLSVVEAHSLSPLQRILLITDGTLTDILEAYFLEEIELVKISQNILLSNADLYSELGINTKVLERKILLHGTLSRNNYVYAESAIALEHLPHSMSDQLLNSNTPLGRLWLDHKLETFKKLSGVHCRPANELASHFGCDEPSPLLQRTYSVSAYGKPIMVITEYFQ